MTDVFNVKNKRTFIIVILIIVVFLGAVLYETDVLNVNTRNTNENESILQSKSYVLKVGDISIRVDIANTPLLREQGLSGRQALPEDQGMYFVFDHPDFYQFWMKEMNFPIDIIWVSETMRIIDVTKDAPPSSFPKTFTSNAPAQYVLEVNAGFVERHGVNIGDQVEIQPF